MDGNIVTNVSEFITQQERSRLIGLCGHLTGNREVAEDLAQETLLEAWKHLEGLRQPEKRTQWLNGIARNVCLRWLRKQGSDNAHLTSLEMPIPSSLHAEPTLLADTLANQFDVEIELEKKELIELLDRGMALLPPDTRAVLVKRFVDESPLNEIATQLGTNLGTVAMRLQRGKLALRRVLTTNMASEIAAYGLASDSSGSGVWDSTRLWCTVCGIHRLSGKLDPVSGYLELRCPICCPDEDKIYSRSTLPTVLKGTRSYKIALKRLIEWSNTYYIQALQQNKATCSNCQQTLPVQILSAEQLPEWFANGSRSHGLTIHCSDCNLYNAILLEGLVYASASGQEFQRQHSRIRLLREQQLEYQGRTAALTTFESINNGARLDVISALDNLEPLHISITG